MSKKDKVAPLDDAILKMVLDKLSVFQSQISMLQLQVQQLEIRSEYPDMFNRKYNSDGVAQ